MKRRAFCTATLALAAGGCANVMSVQTSKAVVRPFRIEGRFSLQHQSDRWIGSLSWDYAPRLERVTLEIAGQTFATFERLDDDVKATLASGLTLEERGWGALTARAIGVSLPLDAAPFWLRGEPQPGPAHQRVNSEEFRQHDWAITVLARDTGKLPTRLRWSNATTTLSLVIDSWNNS
jgi:outer membrane biogenesis lipoprotein LolB